MAGNGIAAPGTGQVRAARHQAGRHQGRLGATWPYFVCGTIWLATPLGCSDGLGPRDGFLDPVDYYVEVALGTEFGSSAPVVHKWPRDITIVVRGSPDEDDAGELRRVVEELNDLLQGRPRLSLAAGDGQGDLDVHFGDASTFGNMLPQYVPGDVRSTLQGG